MHKTKKIVALGFCLATANSYGGSSSINPGSSATLGPSSSSYSIASAFNNPAMNSLMVANEKNLRFSFLPNFGLNLEVGDVDNFTDELDELIDIIDDPGSTTDSAEDVLERFNTTLLDMGESGYLKQSSYFNAPFLPLYYRSDFLGGTLGVGLNWETQIGLRILDDPLTFDDQNGTFSTATALYIKAGIEQNLSVSYGRALLSDKGKDRLYAGVKVKLMNVELSKQVFPILQLDGRDVQDVIKDEYDDNLKSNTNIGIDIGLVWDADNYRVGLTIENLNSPEFDYGTVGENCIDRPENTESRSNCESAAFFIQEKGDIKAKETHTKHALTRVDGLYKLSDHWTIVSSLDLAEYDDVTGFENQWWHIAMAYDANSFVLPSARVGYKKNLAGSETTSLTVGFNLFKYFGLDIEYGLESVDVDGSSYPRRLGLSLGFEQRF